MKYNIGDIFTFPNGETGEIINISEEPNIAGRIEYEVEVNGEIRIFCINEDGKIEY